MSGVSGFASGYVASNGDTNYALRSGLTAAAFNVVGSAFDANTQGIFASVKNASTYKTLAHGFVGGVSSVANGGNFFSGFATAGFSEALSAAGVYGDVKETLGVSSRWGTLAYETVAGSIVGGTTSELTGGTFENGAITAAMGRLFNEAAHGLFGPEIVEVYFLHNKAGANGLGHSAIEFVFSNGSSEIIEKYPTLESFVYTETSVINRHVGQTREQSKAALREFTSARQVKQNWADPIKVDLSNPRAAYYYASSPTRKIEPYVLIGRQCNSFAMETLRQGRPSDFQQRLVIDAPIKHPIPNLVF